MICCVACGDRVICNVSGLILCPACCEKRRQTLTAKEAQISKQFPSATELGLAGSSQIPEPLCTYPSNSGRRVIRKPGIFGG